jgi:hypothetical protein
MAGINSRLARASKRGPAGLARNSDERRSTMNRFTLALASTTALAAALIAAAPVGAHAAELDIKSAVLLCRAEVRQQIDTVYVSSRFSDFDVYFSNIEPRIRFYGTPAAIFSFKKCLAEQGQTVFESASHTE